MTADDTGLILVTGATGFIGSRLTERWSRLGRQVRATGLERSDVEKERAASVSQLATDYVRADLTDSAVLTSLLDQVDTVVHLAAAQHEANIRDDDFARVNVDVTRNLLERSDAAGVRRFFYASSIGVFGSQARDVADGDAVLPDNGYGHSKSAAESMLLAYRGSVRVAIGRIGECYGPWDRRLLKLFEAIEKGRFWLIGPSRNLHQPIFVDDLPPLIDSLLSVPTRGSQPVILAGDEAMTTVDMCESIATSVSRTLPSLKIPLFPVAAAAWTLEETLGRIGIQPPLHRRRLDFFRKNLTFSNDGRKLIMGQTPMTDFSTGINKTLDWYRRAGWLEMPKLTAGGGGYPR